MRVGDAIHVLYVVDRAKLNAVPQNTVGEGVRALIEDNLFVCFDNKAIITLLVPKPEGISDRAEFFCVIKNNFFTEEHGEAINNNKVASPDVGLLAVV